MKTKNVKFWICVTVIATVGFVIPYAVFLTH